MPLIGVDDMETPYWARGYEKVVQASLREVAVAVPRTMAQIVRWAWRAAPRLTLLTGALQLLTGCVQAFGLLATANVFTRLLAEGPTPERVVAALPALAVVVAAYAARGLLDAAEGAVQAALAPRVQRMAEDDLYVALIDVDLVAFDEPDFTQLVERVTDGAPSRVRAAVRADVRPHGAGRVDVRRGHRGGHPAPGAGADRAAGGRPTGLGPGQGGEAGVRLVAAHVVARPTARRGQRADLAAGQRGRGAGLHHAGGAARGAPPDRRRPAHRGDHRRAAAEPRHDDRPRDLRGRHRARLPRARPAALLRGHAPPAGGHRRARDARGGVRDRQLDVPGEPALRIRLHPRAPPHADRRLARAQQADRAGHADRPRRDRAGRGVVPLSRP